MIEFKGSYFDGRSSQATEVTVRIILGRTLTIMGPGGFGKSFNVGEYHYQSRVGKSPLRWKCRDGSLVETPFNADLARKVEQGAPSGSRALTALESRLPLAMGTLVAAGLACVVIYLFGLPLLARALQPFIPYSVKELAGDNTLKALDTILFEESSAPYDKRRETAKMVSELQRATELKGELRVLTRKMVIRGKPIENAFALLPRTIIVTDAILKTLTPEELEGVLAHELGHLIHDHGTQILIRSSALSMVSLALFGGDPGTFHALALVLVEAQYSQGHEKEADLFAMDLLKKVGKNPAVLADALEKLSGKDEQSDVERYVSSHPPTADRMRMLRGE